MTGSPLFRRIGRSTYRPGPSSTGSWDPKLLHGAALAALLAGRLSTETGTVARMSVDFVTPIPMADLDVEVHDEGGGSRVQRRRALVTAGDKLVATGSSLIVREGDLDLPEKARSHRSPFEPETAPPLDRAYPSAGSAVGWDSFVNLAVALEPLKVADDRRIHLWGALIEPVLDDEEPRGIETAIAIADFAQSAVHRLLPFDAWSFRNADLTLHLSRPPVGHWIGLRTEAVVQPVGAGYNAADLFDADGPLARSASSLVVEPRTPRPTT